MTAAANRGNGESNEGLRDSLPTEKVALPVTLCWENLKVRLNSMRCKGCQAGVPPKFILNGVTGIARPGRMLAILGSSGAGKTTLLNVLTARNIKTLEVDGQIYANGVEITDGIKYLSAYVQQDDLFLSTLTVREQLLFRAFILMDKGLTRKARRERVEFLIIELGLSGCASSVIGDCYGSKRGISGGERKRLSFASEILTNPSLVFCDEPTSGLDTFMAQNVIQYLETMASAGRTVVCTIHQPSSDLFAMFHEILLMAEGNVVFSGSSAQALTFFEKLNYRCPQNFNPADHFIQILAIRPGKEDESKGRVQEICRNFAFTDACNDMLASVSQQIRSVSEENVVLLNEMVVSIAKMREQRSMRAWFRQLRCLFWREWVTQHRDVILFRIRLAQSVIFSLLIGVIFYQIDIHQKSVMSRNGALFTIVTYVTFANVFAVLNSFPGQIALFLREYGSGLYTTGAYFISKSVTELPIFFLTTVIFTTVVYWMIGLYNDADTFMLTQLDVFLTAMVGISFGYFVSATTASMNVSLAIAPPLLIPFLMFGGLFINVDDIPFFLKWIKSMSWFHYAYEVLMVNEWRHRHNITCNQALCFFRDGDDVLKYSSFSEDHIPMDLGMLVILMVAFRMLAFVALLTRAKLSKD